MENAIMTALQTYEMTRRPTSLAIGFTVYLNWVLYRCQQRSAVSGSFYRRKQCIHVHHNDISVAFRQRVIGWHIMTDHSGNPSTITVNQKQVELPLAIIVREYVIRFWKLKKYFFSFFASFHTFLKLCWLCGCQIKRWNVSLQSEHLSLSIGCDIDNDHLLDYPWRKISFKELLSS